jgi:uncharacterized protein
MSSIYNKIKSDIIASMKAGSKTVTNTLRLLTDSIQKKSMAKNININDVTDDIVIDCINTCIKQREESITEFKKGNRDDLVQKELAEIFIIKQYQPPQLSKEDLTQIIKDIMMPHILDKALGKPLSIGIIMKDVMKELKGKADGKLINEITQQLIREKS